MKLLLSSFLITSTVAFVPCTHRPRFGTTLALERGDSSDAIADAMEATRKFGANSPEARVAWDIVEEINASDNSAAYSGSSVPLTSEPVFDEELLKEIGEQVFAQPVVPVKNIKLNPPSPSSWDEVLTTAADTSTSDKYEKVTHPTMKKAIGMAELMTEWYGVHSKESRLAWEVVEDIASNDFTEATKGEINTGEECLVELMDACEAMEELERALFSKQKIEE